ncbi:hypothetical protein B0H14DRAFT_2591169 [Mycena olivaceomarginata]|nr:hypothetical protein B0H14DRAFT_2591169 [Mycena olivaceomarginata]
MVNNLGNSLLAQFERLSDLNDLNESISKKKDAVLLMPDGHSDKPGRLNNLGISLLARFERLGDLGDLNESISKMENAVLLTPDARFERLSDLSDLNESISRKKDALLLMPDGHPYKPGRLNNLLSNIYIFNPLFPVPGRMRFWKQLQSDIGLWVYRGQSCLSQTTTDIRCFPDGDAFHRLKHISPS